MQSLDLQRMHARPAAAQARPGTWPSCAQEPGAPAGAVTAAGTGYGTGYASACGGTEIHRDGGIFGQDRRDQEDQRGRAVACA